MSSAYNDWIYIYIYVHLYTHIQNIKIINIVKLLLVYVLCGYIQRVFNMFVFAFIDKVCQTDS